MHLFFNHDGTFSHLAENVQKGLGGVELLEGDSLNQGGTYYDISIFGVTIRLERNNYDYDDKYKYMISIQKDLRSALKVSDSDIDAIGKVVWHMLRDNAEIDAVCETPNGLETLRSQN